MTQLTPWQRRGLEALVLVALVLALGWFQSRHIARGVAPSFELKALDGGTLRAQDLHGKATMLVFWAPWCGVCKLSSRNVSWASSWIGDSARVVSVASHYDDLAEVQAYVREHRVDYPVLLDDRQVARRYGVRAYPTLLFLDETGTIRSAVVGYTTTLGMYLRMLAATWSW